ncbi:MAG TPA: hypothetical protein VD999_00430 [Vitreimonas sp.]|nr:hypothetical protein [Vitreimonas sp.]
MKELKRSVEQNEISRRTFLKCLGLGVAMAANLIPMLENSQAAHAQAEVLDAQTYEQLTEILGFEAEFVSPWEVVSPAVHIIPHYLQDINNPSDDLFALRATGSLSEDGRVLGVLHTGIGLMAETHQAANYLLGINGAFVDQHSLQATFPTAIRTSNGQQMIDFRLNKDASLGVAENWGKYHPHSREYHCQSASHPNTPNNANNLGLNPDVPMVTMNSQPDYVINALKGKLPFVKPFTRYKDLFKLAQGRNDLAVLGIAMPVDAPPIVSIATQSEQYAEMIKILPIPELYNPNYCIDGTQYPRWKAYEGYSGSPVIPGLKINNQVYLIRDKNNPNTLPAGALLSLRNDRGRTANENCEPIEDEYGREFEMFATQFWPAC